MGRRCRVCHHPDHAEIDKRLLSGEAASAIVRDYAEFSLEGVRRHLVNHVRKPLHDVAVRTGALRHPGAALARGEDGVMPMLALGDLVGAMKRNLARLERAADDAENEKARLALAALSGQVSRAVEVAAKVSGVAADGKPKTPPVSVQIVIGERSRVLVAAESTHDGSRWDADA